MKEQSIRQRIRKSLISRGFFVISLVPGPGVPSGTPDLLVIDSESRATLLEVKVPGRYPSALQRFRMSEYEKLGVRCRVVRSDVEAIDAVQS